MGHGERKAVPYCCKPLPGKMGTPIQLICDLRVSFWLIAQGVTDRLCAPERAWVSNRRFQVPWREVCKLHAPSLRARRPRSQGMSQTPVFRPLWGLIARLGFRVRFETRSKLRGRSSGSDMLNADSLKMAEARHYEGLAEAF